MLLFVNLLACIQRPLCTAQHCAVKIYFGGSFTNVLILFISIAAHVHVPFIIFFYWSLLPQHFNVSQALIQLVCSIVCLQLV